MAQANGMQVPQSVVDAVEAFANTRELSEKRALVDARPEELLGEYADSVFAMLIEQYRDDAEVLGGLEADRALLQDSRMRGVAEAFGSRHHRDREQAVTPEVLAELAELRDERLMARYLASRPAVREVLMAAVVAFVETENAAGMGSVLRREADLLRTPPAEMLVRGIAGEVPHLTALADVLAVAREKGVEAAIAAALGPVGDRPPVSGSREVDDIVNELLFADEHLSTERRLALARHGLSLVEPESSLWVLFHITIGNTLLETYAADRADRVEEAIQHQRIALAWAEQRGNVPAASAAHNQLADSYIARIHGKRADNLAEAISHARAATAGFDPEANPRDAARAHELLANALAEGREGLVEAYRQAKRALDLLEVAPHPYTTVGAYQALARIADGGGPDDFHDHGLTYLRQSIALVDRARDPNSWTRASMEFARVALHQETGVAEAVEEALSVLYDTLELSDHDRRPEQWAQVHQLIATAYRWRADGDPADNYAQAIEHAEAALTVYTADAFPDQWAETVDVLADAHRLSLTGNPITSAEKALELYVALAGFHSARGDGRHWAQTEAKIGATLLANRFGPADRLTAAEQHYERARAEFERLGDRDRAAGAHIGLLGVAQQQIEANIAAATPHDHLRYALNNYAREDHPDGYVQARLAGVNLHLTLARHEDRELHVAMAADLLDEAIAAVTPRTEAQVFQARVSLAETSAEQAQAFETIIDQGERLLAATTTEASQREILPALSRAYACLAFVRLHLGHTAEALTLVDRGRARVLLDVLDPGIGLDRLPEPTHARAERARRQIEQLRNALNAPPGPGRLSDTQLGRQLGLARRELANALSGAEAAADGPERPAADAVLVVPLVCALGVALFVLPPGIEEPAEEHIVTLGIDRQAVQDAEVRWLTAAAQQEMGQLNLDQLTDVMHEITGWLWTAIVDPLGQRLTQLGVPAETALRVVFSPLSRLLPLHAAWRMQRDGRWRALVEDRIISYAPSIQLLRQAERRRDQPGRSGSRALLLGDSLGDLPNAEQEVRAVAALTGDEVHLGADASRALLLDHTAGHALVHVACHAAVNWFQPHYSVVQLSDGYAYAAELAGLDLAEARLVVLSACQSAVTEPDPAAGEYTGLTAALLRAGAPAVIATLWSVNDVASSLLMRHFYERLLRDELPPDAALREAQVWLRNVTVAELSNSETDPRLARRWRLLADTPQETPYASPFFWAGYVLVGA
jgi:CHAT domain-containing protein